ncbi:MAG: hypothetical protein WCR75_05860 [Sphaerochaetaceae bacterium]
MNTRQENSRPIIATVICVVCMIAIIVLAATLIRANGTRNFVIIAAVVVAIVVIWNIWSKKRVVSDTKKPSASTSTITKNPIIEVPSQVTTPAFPAETLKETTKAAHKSKDKPKNSTGTVCLIGGHYYCLDHHERSIHIDAGKKFPPCRGAEKPHSAIWSMDKPTGVKPIEIEIEGMRTGSICIESGQYFCKDHPNRVINMMQDKRFPPCQGEGKGHSALWVLQKE